MTARAEPTSPPTTWGTTTRDELPRLVRALIGPKRPNPVVAVYHWRYEILLMVGFPLLVLALDRLIGPIWLLAVVAALAAVVAGVPAVRRFVLARGRTVLVQHRLRTAFAQAPLYSPGGRRPVILWARPASGEVHVLVWCPAGLDLATVRAQRRRLAAACLAEEVAIAQHLRYEHLIVLTVRTARRLAAVPTRQHPGAHPPEEHRSRW
jgi:hypothetical protein